MTSLSLRWRFTLFILLVLGSTTLSGYWSAITFARVSSTAEAKLEHVSGAMALVEKIEKTLENKEDVFVGALAMRGPMAHVAARAERSTFDQLCDDLSRLLTHRDGQAALADLRRSVDLYRRALDAFLQEDSDPDLTKRYQRDVIPVLRQALLDCSQIREHLAGLTLEIASAARDEAKRATWVVSAVALMAVLLSSFAAFHFGRAVVWPIRELTESVEAVRRGNFRRRVPLGAQDELGRLSAGFNRMVEALAEHQRSMRVELVAVASHELKTPITTMRMTLSLLSEAASQFTEKQREMLETAELGCEQLAATVDTFLDLTRIEAGELQLVLDQVDVSRLAKDVAHLFEPRCREAGISLSCTVDPNIAPIRGDAVRLRVVLSNLLSNSLKYTPAGGEVAVGVRLGSWDRASRPAGPRGAIPPRDAVHVTVTDSGSGILPEYRELVFEKFFRVEQYVPPKDEQGARGAGIGLYLSRRVIEAHGGDIHCDAPPSGRGTRMTVLLPVVGP